MVFIGHRDLKSHLNTLKDKAEAFRRGGVKVPNFIMNLSRGNGQSHLAESITEALAENGIRKFYGLDTLIEYRLDGSLNQLKYIFENDIKTRSVYTNSFVGVIAIDISALADCANEYQVEYLTQQLAFVSEDATLIVFYDDQLGKPIEQVKRCVVNEVGNFIDIKVVPYTIKDYSDIVVENIRERDIEITYGKEMEELLYRIIDLNHVTTAKQAVSIADKLVLLADYSDFVPRLDLNIISKHF